MGREIELSCRCGAVHGHVSNVSPSSVNRIVCYCADCQAYIHQLGRLDLLDAHGGSDIVQVAPAAISFDRGQEHIRGLRLSEKGLKRFYAGCCNTPLGNTVGPAVPFVGMAAQLFAVGDAGALDAAVGAPRGRVYGQHAVGTPPPGSTEFPLALIARLVFTMLTWAVRGKGKPNPFFDTRTRQPLYPLLTLSSAEREALRPLCGPRAA